MQEQWAQECADLRAEVAALQQQVQALMAAQPVSVKAPALWRVSKSVRFVVLPAFIVLVVGGVPYGKDAYAAISDSNKWIRGQVLQEYSLV